MHIAICDDEKKELLFLQALVNKFDPTISTYLYKSAEDMFNGLKTQPCDIVLLDIEMDGMNGFKAAEILNKMENPPLVIFVTNSGEYLHRGYKVAFRYVPKPVGYERLAENLADAIKQVTPLKITISTSGRTYVLPINDIIYFESFRHNLMVYTKNEKIESRMTLSKVETLLPNHLFASPYKGYLVNLKHVKKINADELLLANKLKTPLSRGQKKKFEQALFKYVREFQ